MSDKGHTVKQRSRNICREILERVRDESADPYDPLNDGVVDEAVLALDHALMANDTSRHETLRPIVMESLKAVDRAMAETRKDRSRLVQVGQTEFVIADYDPDAVLTVGDRERIRKGSARRPHWINHDRILTDNLIAQNAAYAGNHREAVSFIDALEPLDPRTTSDDVVRDIEPLAEG